MATPKTPEQALEKFTSLVNTWKETLSRLKESNGHRNRIEYAEMQIKIHDHSRRAWLVAIKKRDAANAANSPASLESEAPEVAPLSEVPKGEAPKAEEPEQPKPKKKAAKKKAE